MQHEGEEYDSHKEVPYHDSNPAPRKEHKAHELPATGKEYIRKARHASKRVGL